MKKIVLFVLLFIIPINVWATTFDLKDTDMSITIDEDIWYVFTPDNILDNPELDELGISYEYMVDVFSDNHAYLDAVLFFQDSDDYIEIFVRKTEVDDVKNLSNYSLSDIEEFGKTLAEEQNAQYEIYQKNYSFAFLTYQDLGFYLNEYYTIINGYAYSITAQKPYSFTSEDTLRVREIVDSIEFDVDESLEEPQTGINWNKVFIDAVIAGLVAALISFVFTLIRKKKNKKNED